MSYIQLNELHYNGSGYDTTPVLCNTNEVSNVFESVGDSFRSTCVVMNGGKYYNVQDSYDDIIRGLAQNVD